MGLATAELYNNLGLCCFYAQQYDMTITCLQRALHIAEDQETLAEVWYNVGHLSLGIGDVNLAYQCFKLALTANHDHAESYNNIGVLEMRKGKVNQLLVLYSANRWLYSDSRQPKPLLARRNTIKARFEIAYRAHENLVINNSI